MASKKKTVQEVVRELKTFDQRPVMFENERIEVGKQGFHRLLIREDQKDALALLAELPRIVEDSLAHSELIATAVAVVASQQLQIEELQAKVAQVTDIAVALSVERDMTQLLQRLAELGSDVDEPEVTVNVEATSDSEHTGGKWNETGEAMEIARANQIGAALKGLLDGIQSLNIGVDLARTGTKMSVEKLQEYQSTASKQSRRAQVSFRFKSIKGSPMAKAQADAHRSAPGKNGS